MSSLELEWLMGSPIIPKRVWFWERLIQRGLKTLGKCCKNCRSHMPQGKAPGSCLKAYTFMKNSKA